MFENISGRLQEISKKLRNQGIVNEKNIQDVLREIRLAFLEADVDYKVTKDFVEAVKTKALGQEVLSSLSPGQVVMKYVAEELIHLMGDNPSRIKFASVPPTVIMLVGLQGTGKTTTIAKLAKHFVKNGHRPLLAALDIYRPAAQEQLKVLGGNINVPVFIQKTEDCVGIAKNSLQYARSNNNDCLLLDTAGRLQIDSEMMEELEKIKKSLGPHEILLVVDAMTGQEAVNIAKEFNSTLGIDGVILTKLDGDAKAGAALSLAAVVKKPIKFVGIGEKLEDLDIFYPDRIASRILGQGDIFTLAEQVNKVYSEEEAKRLEKKLMKNEFTLEDMREQFKYVKKLGSFENIVKMIPGIGNKIKVGENEKKNIVVMEAILNSMTKKERLNPKVLNGSRRTRIANGSGTTVQDVNRLINQYEQMKKMMKQFGQGSKFDNIKRMMSQ